MPQTRKRARGMATERGFRPSRTGTLRRAQRGKNALVRVPRNKLAFPTSMKTKLRYTERVELLPGSSTTSVGYTFRGNGIYDPYAGVGGHQPRGFDQYMAIYQTFTVSGSSCKASFQYEYYDGPTQASVSAYNNLIQCRQDPTTAPEECPALSSVIVGIRKASSTFLTDSVANQLEKDKMVHASLVPTAAAKNLSMKGTTKEFFGKTALTGSSGFTGSDSADPTEQWLWHVWCGRASDNVQSDLVRIVAFVTLEYDVIFTEPKQLTQS